MTTWTTTRSQLSVALAEVLDFSQIHSEHESFAALADAILQHLTEHPSPAHTIYADPPRRGLSDAVLAAAQAAGRELGMKRTTYTGELAGECAPSPTRSARLRALADAQPIR